MVQTILRKFTTACISLVALCAEPLELIACSFGPEDEDLYYSFFKTDDLTPTNEPVYMFNGWVLESDETDSVGMSYGKEWCDLIGKDCRENDISKLVFESDPQEVFNIAEAIQQKRPVHEVWKDNSVVDFWKNHPDNPIFTYLMYAKKCEPLVSDYSGDSWDEGETTNDSIDKENLIREGLKLHGECKKEDLRLRYAFQVVRLAHYNGDFKSCIRYYDELVQPNKSNGSLKVRSLNHKVGAMILMSRESADSTLRPKALALLASYYDIHGARVMTFEDLGAFDAQDYLDAEKLVVSNNEKVRLWGLAGIVSVPRFVALEKIYSLNPKDPLTESMLANMMDRWQQEYLEGKMDYYWIEKGEASELNQTETLIEKIATEQRTSRPALWNMAAGFINYLSNNYTEAHIWYHKNKSLKPNSTDSIYAVQQRLSLLLDAKEWTLGKTDRNSAATTFARIISTGHDDLIHYSLLQLYPNADPLDKQLITNILNDEYRDYSNGNFTEEINQPVIDQLINDHTLKSDGLRNLLWTLSGHSNYTLEAIKVHILVRTHKFIEAESIVTNTGFIDDHSLMADPFSMRLVDCHDCDHADKMKKAYTMRSFIKKMAELQAQIGKKGKGTAEAMFRFANALYNMTMYGNSRDIIKSDQGNSYFEDFYEDPEPKTTDFGLKEGVESDKPYLYLPEYYYNCRPAMTYYLEAAMNSTDKEFKAKCYFMAAKCQQNEFYNRGGEDYRDYTDIKPGSSYAAMIALKNSHYRNGFAALKQYAGTKFYAKAIKECTYFSHYLKRK